MCDRYGGALAWDRHCAEREAAYEAMRRSATCADCVHGHVFNGGVGDAMRGVRLDALGAARDSEGHP